LQGAAVRALRAGLIEYDQRHGYRGPAGRVTLPAGARDQELSQALEEYSPRGGLVPALILSVDEKSAVAYTRANGRISLAWPAISWARAPLPDGSVGPQLQRAADVLAKNDIVYVAQEVSGNWRMLQVPDIQGALVAVDPKDGAIAALTGGFDYYASNYNRAVQAKRQPGSAFKPFLYSAALEQGFTPATLVNDAPLVIEDPTLEGSWRPQNVTREFRGPMRLREALVRSRNLVSIRVMHSLGPAYATQYIERFGFPKDSLPRNLSLALGTASVSPLEMAGAYAVFANGGFKVEPYYLDRIVSPEGKVVYESQPRFACPECLQPPTTNAEGTAGEGGSETASDAPIRAPSNDEMRWGGLTYLQEQWLAPSVISPQNDFLMTDMMSDVIRRGTATRALQLKRTDLAGKTGTTNDRRDTWFCGFNAGLVATAWVGFDQERSLGPGEEGGRTALPMWVYFMAEALKGVPEQRRPAPPGLVSMRISADTGLAARPGDPDAIFETFMAGHLPAEPQLDSALGEGQQDSEEKKEDDSLF